MKFSTVVVIDSGRKLRIMHVFVKIFYKVLDILNSILFFFRLISCCVKVNEENIKGTLVYFVVTYTGTISDLGY